MARLPGGRSGYSCQVVGLRLPRPSMQCVHERVCPARIRIARARFYKTSLSLVVLICRHAGARVGGAARPGSPEQGCLCVAVCVGWAGGRPGGRPARARPSASLSRWAGCTKWRARRRPAGRRPPVFIHRRRCRSFSCAILPASVVIAVRHLVAFVARVCVSYFYLNLIKIQRCLRVSCRPEMGRAAVVRVTAEGVMPDGLVSRTWSNVPCLP